MAAPPCSAASYKNAKANIQFEMDDSWQVTSREPLTLVAPGGETVLVFEVTKASNMEEAVAGAETYLAVNLADISLGVPKYTKINGIPAAEIDGPCRLKNELAACRTLVLEGAKGTYTLLYYFGAKGHEQLNSDALARFVGSIRKLR
jgi:hypothetical protein